MYLVVVGSLSNLVAAKRSFVGQTQMCKGETIVARYRAKQCDDAFTYSQQQSSIKSDDADDDVSEDDVVVVAAAASANTNASRASVSSFALAEQVLSQPHC